MEIKTISEINEYVGTSINPIETPDELFELYSVPSYDNQYPEIIKGSAIGSTKITVQENDVLICKINPRINRVWIVKQHTPYRLLASSEWIVVRNKQINPQYLQWYFSSPPFRDKITSQVAGIGGSLTRAQPKVVANYPVPIPSLHDQNKVANSLDQLERLISLRKKQLQKLDDLVKARFVEMFGDPVSNPKGWKKRKLSDLADIRIGPFGSLLHKEDYVSITGCSTTKTSQDLMDTIYNGTKPSLFTDIELVGTDEGSVFVISVDAVSIPVATSTGVYFRRLGKTSKPFFPVSETYKITETMDFSSRIIEELDESAIDHTKTDGLLRLTTIMSRTMQISTI